MRMASGKRTLKILSKVLANIKLLAFQKNVERSKGLCAPVRLLAILRPVIIE